MLLLDFTPKVAFKILLGKYVICLFVGKGCQDPRLLFVPAICIALPNLVNCLEDNGRKNNQYVYDE